MGNFVKMAHIAVHVQKGFFDPPAPRPSEEARQPFVNQVAGRIARTAAAFSACGVPTIWLRFQHDDLSEESEKLYRVKLESSDILVNDTEKPTALNREALAFLRDRGIETVCVSGGYASLCVQELVQDVVSKGFNVFVMKDCLIDNQDEIDLRSMFTKVSGKQKAEFVNSREILEGLGAIVPQAREPVIAPKFIT